MVADSAIEAKLNLRCEVGHRWYSPEPAAFVGHECGRILPNNKPCRKILHRMRKRR